MAESGGNSRSPDERPAANGDIDDDSPTTDDDDEEVSGDEGSGEGGAGDEGSGDSALAQALFKAGDERADTSHVEDGIGGRPRLSWNPVTDTGGAPNATPRSDRSGFEFDLGGALARLDGKAPGHVDDDVAPASAPVAEPAGPESEPTVQPAPPAAASAPVQSPPPAAPKPVAPGPIAAEPIASDPVVSDDDVLPRRGAATPDDGSSLSGAPAPVDEPIRPYAVPRRSVFDDDVLAPVAPTVPAAPTATPPNIAPPAPAAPAARVAPATTPQPPAQAPNVATPTARVAPATTPRPAAPTPNTAPSATTISPSTAPATLGAEPMVAMPATIAPDRPELPPEAAAGLPYLPASEPAAPMVATPAANAVLDAQGSPADVQAARTAQLRASQKQRKGKLVGRVLIALAVIGALLGAALIFGRSYLFPSSWDEPLTPIVDEVQAAHGADFDHTVPLVVQPAETYATTVMNVTVGTDWTTQLPRWRALGLTAGDPTPASVGAAVAAVRPAVFDPATDTIYQLEGSDADAIGGDLRFALEDAYEFQLGEPGAESDAAEPAESVTDPSGFLGVSPTAAIIDAAIDAELAGATVTPTQPAVGLAPTVPAPIAYEIAAERGLGGAILVAADVDADDLSLDAEPPAEVYDVLDDDPQLAAVASLVPGDIATGDPVALGVDDWSLVWAARLPSSTVDRLAEVVVADSYRPIDRSGVACFNAVFESTTQANSGLVLSAMARWVAATPASAQATAAVLTPTSVTIRACDPGLDGATSVDGGAAEQLVVRQYERLAG